MLICGLGDDELFGPGKHLAHLFFSELLCNFSQGNLEFVAVPVLFAPLAVLAEDADNLASVFEFSEGAQILPDDESIILGDAYISESVRVQFSSMLRYPLRTLCLFDALLVAL